MLKAMYFDYVHNHVPYLKSLHSNFDFYAAYSKFYIKKIK